jgi:hypothetical protein
LFFKIFPARIHVYVPCFLILITGRPNFEESGPTSVGRKHEFIRSESENWRIYREEQNGEDEDGGWRLAGSRRDGERWRPHSPGKNYVVESAK